MSTSPTPPPATQGALTETWRDRCDWCGWPIDPEGKWCRADDCSMRPRPKRDDTDLRQECRHAEAALRAAAAERDQLARRCADMDLMLRAKMSGGYQFNRKHEGGWQIACGTGSRGGFRNARGAALGWDWVLEVSDDGTGIPVLTDEARAALSERDGGA